MSAGFLFAYYAVAYKKCCHGKIYQIFLRPGLRTTDPAGRAYDVPAILVPISHLTRQRCHRLQNLETKSCSFAI